MKVKRNNAEKKSRNQSATAQILSSTNLEGGRYEMVGREVETYLNRDVQLYRCGYREGNREICGEIL
jgi:hypothetical protein